MGQEGWSIQLPGQVVVAVLFLIGINLASFILMGVDKRKARRHEWRIPEKTLFLYALLGGSVGAILGMFCFHHKTKHWYFVWGMPTILIVQLLLAFCLIR